ncbi:hypothetical protein [Streptosporangium roseum]|uniref:hypothetical protein n=1 Tax=Streptosporangium roseum TaxID=2001 RepID=UPI0004CD0618|nr:hypothetical protein [Streptosporangium roseum]
MDIGSGQLVREAFPRLAAELAVLLRQEGEDVLATSVDGLRVHSACGCRDDFCTSFNTAAPSDGAYGDGHRNIMLEPVEPVEGMLILDVVDEEIVFVEVLYRERLT